MTINFGEISPANTNSLVKVVVPIAIRSSQPYQVAVTIAGLGNANPQALQSSDIGFGANNMRALGANARVCTNSSHIFHSPFGNDPAVTKTIGAKWPGHLSVDAVQRISFNSDPERSATDQRQHWYARYG